MFISPSNPTMEEMVEVSKVVMAERKALLPVVEEGLDEGPIYRMLHPDILETPPTTIEE